MALENSIDGVGKFKFIQIPFKTKFNHKSHQQMAFATQNHLKRSKIKFDSKSHQQMAFASQNHSKRSKIKFSSKSHQQMAVGPPSGDGGCCVRVRIQILVTIDQVTNSGRPGC